ARTQVGDAEHADRTGNVRELDPFGHCGGRSVLPYLGLSRTHALEPVRPDPELGRPFGEGAVFGEDDPAEGPREPVEPKDRLRRMVQERASEGFEPTVPHAPPDLVREEHR